MEGKLLNLARKLPKPKPVSMIIYEKVLNAIVSGKIKEGQRIVESELSKLFGVSRSPVREALKMLEIDGLIELIPYRGVVVTQITAKDVRESLELKGMVEGFAAWIGAQKFSRKVVEEIESIVAEAEKFVLDEKLQLFLESNIRFHRLTVKNACNEKLLKYYDTLTCSIRRFYSISFAISVGWEFSLDEHRIILDCIKAKDAAGAELAARQHAWNTIDRILTRMGKKN
jgi:DNA-binding GntR family transcriptional regulator